MNTWTSITAEAVSNYLSPIQLTALRQNLDPLNQIIADTIAHVRCEIQTNPINPVSLDPTLVPREVKGATCHLIIEALQSRIPTLKLSEDQIRNANNARAYLKRMANSEIALDPSTLTGRIDLAHRRHRQISSQSLLGL